MLIQGPVFPFFSEKKRIGFKTGGDAVNGNPSVESKRIDRWIQSNIHVNGMKNIIFVKTHTHGATDEKAVLGAEMQFILSHLEKTYNDGNYFKLHYVSAREAYNIVKAIEFGEKITEPEMYKNFLIKTPRYDTSTVQMGSTSYLQELVSNSYIE